MRVEKSGDIFIDCGYTLELEVMDHITELLIPILAIY